jgi:signal peptidase I
MNNDYDPSQTPVNPTPPSQQTPPGVPVAASPQNAYPQALAQQPLVATQPQQQSQTTLTPSSSPAPIRPAASSETPEAQPGKREGLRSVLSTIGILMTAPLIAIFMIAFVFQSYQVDGPSMETTLQNNDRLIVWKLPRTWARITGHAYQPNRGDIIIFNEPDLSDYGQGIDKQLIKRVVGLPGERVVVKDGKVTVYNQEYPGGFQPDKTLPYGEGGSHIPQTDGDVDITLPAGQIFVCGDNRPDSLDSRAFGPVPLDNVVGKLAVRILPLSTAERF